MGRGIQDEAAACGLLDVTATRVDRGAVARGLLEDGPGRDGDSRRSGTRRQGVRPGSPGRTPEEEGGGLAGGEQEPAAAPWQGREGKVTLV
jgi:hypothetical protein